MANFIDFVVEVSKNKKIGKDFIKMIQKSTSKELTEWFNSKGYSVSEEEAKKLIDNKDNIKKSSSVRHY